MKLYATITSERASKGQGGQKYLKGYISIAENGGWQTIPYQEMIWWKALLKNVETNAPSLSLRLPKGWSIEEIENCPDGTTFLLAHRGKQQKGETACIHGKQHGVNEICTPCQNKQ